MSQPETRPTGVNHALPGGKPTSGESAPWSSSAQQQHATSVATPRRMIFERMLGLYRRVTEQRRVKGVGIGDHSLGGDVIGIIGELGGHARDRREQRPRVAREHDVIAPGLEREPIDRRALGVGQLDDAADDVVRLAKRHAAPHQPPQRTQHLAVHRIAQPGIVASPVAWRREGEGGYGLMVRDQMGRLWIGQLDRVEGSRHGWVFTTTQGPFDPDLDEYLQPERLVRAFFILNLTAPRTAERVVDAVSSIEAGLSRIIEMFAQRETLRLSYFGPSELVRALRTHGGWTPVSTGTRNCSVMLDAAPTAATADASTMCSTPRMSTSSVAATRKYNCWPDPRPTYAVTRVVTA